MTLVHVDIYALGQCFLSMNTFPQSLILFMSFIKNILLHVTYDFKTAPCVVLLFSHLPSDVRRISVAYRTLNSALTVRKGEHLVISFTCQEHVGQGKRQVENK